MINTERDERMIRDLLEAWVIWRDRGDWDRLAALWHPNGQMVSTFFRGSATAFIAACRTMKANGTLAQHTLGGTALEVRGTRAVADTRMSIDLRASVEGVLCDVRCVGRFYDLLVTHNGAWKLSSRQAIYEKDRLDPVDRSELKLDVSMLDRFPAGYRHLAYVQCKAGLSILPNLPGTSADGLKVLYEEGQRWLQHDGP